MGVAILDREYRILRFNETWESFSQRYTPPSGAPLEPGVGYFQHVPDTEATVLPLFERVLAGEAIQQNGVRLESGKTVTYWDVVLTPLTTNDEVTGILCISSDTTEDTIHQQNLEQRIETRARELDRRREIAESMQDIISMINAKMPLQEFLDQAVKMAAQRLGAGGCVLHHFDVEKQVISHVTSYGLEGVFEKGTQHTFGELKPSAADDYVAATLAHQPTYTNYEPYADWVVRIQEDNSIPEPIKANRIALRESFSGSFSVPLFIQNQVYGGMVFYYTEPQEFSDEQIQLGLSFAEQVAVAIENARLHQSDQDRQRELQMLLDVAATANSSLNLDEMLATTLDLLVAMVGASRAGVSLLDEESGQLTPSILRPERDVDPEEMAKIMQASQAVIESGELMYVNPNTSKGFLEPGALVPIQIRDRKLGMLGIIGKQGSEFSQSQLALFKSIADQLGVAIENARLFQHAEDAAISAERNRLARDLHDAVSQTLFSASLIADVLPKLAETNPEVVKQKLEELRILTRGALSEMRTLLFELRPTALADTDLHDLIGHQVNAFNARTRMHVDYQFNCKDNPPTDVKEAFYRITQEAFNNIAKHADATRVSITLDCSIDNSELVIQDNGIGFEKDKASSDGLGLGIMRERALNISAEIDIQSKIHAGTRLRLYWQGKPGE